MSSEIRPPVGPPRSSNPKPFQRSLVKNATKDAIKDATRDAPRDRRNMKLDRSPKKEKTSSRATLVKEISINLTHEDPVERLKEFCELGKYIFHWNWDKFLTGVMCELEISYQLDANSRSKGDRRKILAKESRYISSAEGDLTHAQKVVAAILLDRLGLGVPAQNDVSEEEDSRGENSKGNSPEVRADNFGGAVGDEIMENLMKSLATKLNQTLSDATAGGVSSVFEAACASVTNVDPNTSPNSNSPNPAPTTSMRWADIVKDKLGGK